MSYFGDEYLKIRRPFIILAGFIILFFGVALLVLPGLGIPIVIVGLVLLAGEYFMG